MRYPRQAAIQSVEVCCCDCDWVWQPRSSTFAPNAGQSAAFNHARDKGHRSVILRESHYDFRSVAHRNGCSCAKCRRSLPGDEP